MDESHRTVSTTSSHESSDNLPDEPDLIRYPYAGWIPCVTGRLSYRHIGESSHPTDAKCANLPAGTRRLILAFQSRPLSDAIFQPISHRIAKISGDFCFAICANSTAAPEDESDIEGRVYIFKTQSDWSRWAKGTATTSIATMKREYQGTSAGRFAAMEASFEDAGTAFHVSADISVEFHLQRSGEIFFGDPVYLDSELRAASDSFAEAEGHNFNLAVANQAYSFLRDISHTHQHHSEKSDMILILQRRGADPVRWRKHVIYSLQYYIIKLKRQRRKGALSQAMGILAYYKSFVEIAKRSLGKEKAKALPQYNDEAELLSLEARQRFEVMQEGDASTDKGLRIAENGARQAILVAMVAVVIAGLSPFITQSLSDHRSPGVQQAYEFIINHLLGIIYAVIIFLFVAYAGPRLARKWLATSSPFGRGIIELTNVRRVLFMWVTGIGVILVFGAAIIVGRPGIVVLLDLATKILGALL